jgi:hypothetical protein
VESIIGAIYISEDFSPSGAEAVFDNLLKPFYDRHVTLKTLSHHPTKILFELFQAQGCQQFEIVKEKDEDQQLTCCDGKAILLKTWAGDVDSTSDMQLLFTMLCSRAQQTQPRYLQHVEHQNLLLMPWKETLSS